MFKLTSIGLKYLFLLILLGFAAGSLRIEVILQQIGPDLKNIIRASSYISLFISGLFSFVIILFAFYITTLVQPMQYKAEIVPYFTHGIQYFSIVMMLVELAKVALLFIFLKNEVGNIDVKEMAKHLQQTQWYKLQTLFNLLGIVAGSYAFAEAVLKKSGVAKGGKSLLLLMLPPIVLLVIASMLQF